MPDQEDECIEDLGEHDEELEGGTTSEPERDRHLEADDIDLDTEDEAAEEALDYLEDSDGVCGSDQDCEDESLHGSKYEGDSDGDSVATSAGEDDDEDEELYW